MKKHIIGAISALSCLKFFPTEAAARTALMQLLERMVSTPAQLNWLVFTLIDHVGTYEGPDQIRAVFCTHFRPKDGIEANLKPGSAWFKTEEQLVDEYRLNAYSGPQELSERARSVLALIGDGKRFPE